MPTKIERSPSAWQKYIAEVKVNGSTKVAAFDLAFPDEADKSPQTKLAAIATFEKTELYQSLEDATMVGISNALQKSAEKAAVQMMESYSDLLTEGTKAIQAAKKTNEKILAMSAQRENLGAASSPMSVISSMSNDNRNKEIPEKTTRAAEAVIIE